MDRLGKESGLMSFYGGLALLGTFMTSSGQDIRLM